MSKNPYQTTNGGIIKAPHPAAIFDPVSKAHDPRKGGQQNAESD